MKRHLWLVCNLLRVHYRIKIFLTKSLLIRKIVFSALSVACCCRKTCHAQGSGSLGIKNPWLFYFRCGVSHAQTEGAALLPGAVLTVPLTNLLSGKRENYFFQLSEAKIGMWESGWLFPAEPCGVHPSVQGCCLGPCPALRGCPTARAL